MNLGEYKNIINKIDSNWKHIAKAGDVIIDVRTTPRVVKRVAVDGVYCKPVDGKTMPESFVPHKRYAIIHRDGKNIRSIEPLEIAKVGDIILPPWSNGDAYEFTVISSNDARIFVERNDGKVHNKSLYREHGDYFIIKPFSEMQKEIEAKKAELKQIEEAKNKDKNQISKEQIKMDLEFLLKNKKANENDKIIPTGSIVSNVVMVDDDGIYVKYNHGEYIIIEENK